VHRSCARPTCAATAIATMGYDYAGRTVWILHLDDNADPRSHDLCSRHADTLAVPLGWSLDDRRRIEVRPLFVDEASG